MLYEKIIAAYHASPVDDRSSRTAAKRLQNAGHSVSTFRVRQILEVTVLDDISDDDIVTTARTLKRLVDVADEFGAEG